MSKSAIYTVNSSAQALAVGNNVALGNVTRRFGNCCTLTGSDAISLNGTGYYDVSAEITLTGTTAGATTVTAYLNGTAVPGAITTETLAVGDVRTIGISALVRHNCCCNPAQLTFVLSGTAATVSNIAVVVEKI